MQEITKPDGISPFLKCTINFQEREKCEKMGIEINEEGVIDIYLPDVNAIMTKDGEENKNILFLFLNGIDIEVMVNDPKAVKAYWRKIKNKEFNE
jgi:hypothetical protein